MKGRKRIGVIFTSCLNTREQADIVVLLARDERSGSHRSAAFRKLLVISAKGQGFFGASCISQSVPACPRGMLDEGQLPFDRVQASRLQMQQIVVVAYATSEKAQ